jgi:hypothetical protein
MSLAAEQAAFLLDFCKLVQFATERGFTVTPGELQRPVEMQKIYVQTGRSQTMDSRHVRKLAGDLNFIKGGRLVYDYDELEPIGRYWESLSPKNRWGGNFDRDWDPNTGWKDLPHFERVA